MIELRESTANQEVPLGYFLDSTNGDDEEGSLTINNTDIKIWKWGATSLVNKNSGGATHMSNGIYYITLDATDTDTVGPGVIFVHVAVIFVHVAGALAVRLEFAVLPANVWDSKYGSDKLQVDVTQIGGETQSATDLKDFADTGYDPSTHKVQGVVLTDTCTTNTDMRGTDNAATASALSTHDGKLDTVDSNVDAIKAKTDNLNFNSDGTPLVLADIRDVNDTAVTGVNDFKADVSNLDVAVSSRSSHSAADVWSVGTRALTDKSNFNLASDQSGVIIGTVNALGTQAKADVNAEVDTALSDIGLDHLISASVTGTDITDNSIIAKLVSKSGTADWDDFDNTTDSLQAIRDALVDASPLGHSATANSEEGNTVLVDGDYTDTATADGVNYYETSPGAAVGGYGLDCNLTFNIGTGRIPSVAVVRGHFDSGAQRTVQVWAYNYNTSSYDQVSNSTNDFGNSGTDTTEEYALGIDNVKISDGEVKIRFTSTSETGGDVWYCDYVNVASVAQEAAGLTADTIQKAVWARSSTNGDHDDGTLGYNLSRMFLVQGDVVSATNATKFIIDSGSSVDNVYNGMIITLEDKTDDHYETRRIIDYTGSTKEITVDRALGFTPAAGDEYYILNAYADVNVTHISGTAQTANDNGADINAILEDTNELQTNQGNWVTATGFATSAELSTHDGKLDTVDSNVDAIKAKTDNLPDNPAAVGSEMNLAADQSGVTIGTVNALGTQAKADVNAEVDSALDTAIPSSPTAGSLNDYMKRVKTVVVNKMKIEESTGNTELFDDDDNSLATITAAFVSDGETTTRKRLE